MKDWESFKNSQVKIYNGVHFIKFANLECTDCISIANLTDFTTDLFWKMFRKLGLLKTFSKSLRCNRFTSWVLQQKAHSFINNEVHVRSDWGSAKIPMYPKEDLLYGNFFPVKALTSMPEILLKVDSTTEIFRHGFCKIFFKKILESFLRGITVICPLR